MKWLINALISMHGKEHGECGGDRKAKEGKKKQCLMESAESKIK